MSQRSAIGSPRSWKYFEIEEVHRAIRKNTFESILAFIVMTPKRSPLTALARFEARGTLDGGRRLLELPFRVRFTGESAVSYVVLRKIVIRTEFHSFWSW